MLTQRCSDTARAAQAVVTRALHHTLVHGCCSASCETRLALTHLKGLAELEKKAGRALGVIHNARLQEAATFFESHSRADSSPTIQTSRKLVYAVLQFGAVAATREVT